MNKILASILLVIVTVICILFGLFYLVFIADFYNEKDAKADLTKMGFELQDKLRIVENDHSQGPADEFRNAKFLISNRDKENIILTIKSSPFYTTETNDRNEKDSIFDYSYISIRDDEVIYSRDYYSKRNNTYYSVWIYTSNDTIQFCMERP